MRKDKEHNHVSDKELDNLLNQAFLNLDFTNPKNQELMETISQETMQPKPIFAENILKSLFSKIILTCSLIIATIFIYLAFFKTTTDHLTVRKLSPATNANSITSQIKSENPKQEINTTTAILPVKEDTTETSHAITEVKQDLNNKPVVLEQVLKTKPTNLYEEEPKIRVDDTGFVFPKLTEEEIKKNNKRKFDFKMTLARPSKDWYPLIGEQKANGNLSDTTAAFYIASSEVSNLQYRTFLWDLIINENKEDFLKAKPHQELWLTAPGQPNRKKMKDNYFVDEKYNDYPVVNITPEGAELYCTWLSNLFDGDAELHARLPYESEWNKAAKPTKRNGSYTWGTDSIQNKVGCFLANFCIQKSREQLKTKMICTPKNKNAYTSAEFMVGDSMMTCKVNSYNPNYSGVYCMAGNVAEMVYKNSSKQVTTKGGSWNSDLENCKNYNEEELTGPLKANPMTGFRPLLRYTYKKQFGSYELEDPKTGLSTLTQNEIKTYKKEKQKMLESLIKFTKTDYAMIPMGTCVYKGEAVSVAPFYIQTTEVSNLQYRTFLADLILQKRDADYIKAKPDQAMWMKKFPWSFNQPMTDNYFWHPAYNEYPVVNISREAAEMYCIWLTVETNKVLKEKNKPLMNDLRIPTATEWAYAASNNKNQVRYANGTESLKDTKGKYTSNYSCYFLSECKYDEATKIYLPQVSKKPADKESQDRAFISDGYFHTAPTKAYSPNSYGLYCMAGNVSEMVWNFDTKNNKVTGKGTKGGSWFSADEFLQIDANEEYPDETGPSPLIGFRPVISVPQVKGK